jgi:outer membrane protein
MEAIKTVGKENGFTYIHDQAALLYAADNSEDILPLVKKKLGIQ